MIAIALLALCAVQTGRMMTAMATTSLSTDEFGSVGGYSRRGPLRVMTDYRAPKNHIFFNLLNSLLPGRSSLNPARARMLSLLAGALFAATLVWYAARRGALLEGAAILSLWTFSQESLELCLQARGYGFLALAALWGCICTTEYLRTRRAGWLIGNAAAVTLGVYTVPGFLFFGAPLLLILWAVTRDRAAFFSGLAAVVAIAALYSPVALQVHAAFGQYGLLYESDFKFAQGVFRAVNLYLFSAPDWAIFFFFMALAIAPFRAGGRLGEPRLRGEGIVMAAALMFFGGLLYIRTSPVRMADMGMVPFAFAGVFAIGAMIRALPPLAGAACFAATGMLLAVRAVPKVCTFEFLPHENWSLAGQVVDHAFDPGMRIDFARYAKYLGSAIRDPEKRSAPWNERAYAEGRMAVADAGNKWAEGQLFFRPKEEAHNAEISIAGATRNIVLTFQIPAQARLGEAPRELTDRDAATGVAPAMAPVRVRPAKNAAGMLSVVFLLNREARTKLVRISADGVDCSAQAIYAGNALILPGDHSGQSLEIEAKDRSLLVTEAWAVPSAH